MGMERGVLLCKTSTLLVRIALVVFEILRPHFAKNERLSGAKTVPERVHWGGVEGVSIVPHLCGGAVGVLTCPVVWVGDYRDPFFVYFFP